MKTSSKLLWLATGTLVATVVAMWWIYGQLGRTPGELMDYADVRMSGHPKVQKLTQPFESALRTWFDAPSAEERSSQPFVVPPPPPRRGPTDIRTPEPVPTGATVWHVGPQSSLTRIANAAALAKSGDVIEIEAGDYHGDVALWTQKKLTIRIISHYQQARVKSFTLVRCIQRSSGTSQAHVLSVEWRWSPRRIQQVKKMTRNCGT